MHNSPGTGAQGAAQHGIKQITLSRFDRGRCQFSPGGNSDQNIVATHTVDPDFWPKIMAIIDQLKLFRVTEISYIAFKVVQNSVF